jgi:hypothetical protein
MTTRRKDNNFMKYAYMILALFVASSCLIFASSERQAASPGINQARQLVGGWQPPIYKHDLREELEEGLGEELALLACIKRAREAAIMRGEDPDAAIKAAVREFYAQQDESGDFRDSASHAPQAPDKSQQ